MDQPKQEFYQYDRPGQKYKPTLTASQTHGRGLMPKHWEYWFRTGQSTPDEEVILNDKTSDRR